MSTVPRIALIHATQLAISPIEAAFDRLWPEAQRMNILDDRLSLDLAERGNLDATMYTRIATLGRYAVDQGCVGILFTCSAFGPAIESAATQLGVPALKPNEAMFQEAGVICSRVPGSRVGLLTTFQPSAKPMADEFFAMHAESDAPPKLECAFADGAMKALAAGDSQLHDQLIVQAAKSLADCDVLMLGQFSMARAGAQVASATSKPVLSSPDSAVRALRRILDAGR